MERHETETRFVKLERRSFTLKSYNANQTMNELRFFCLSGAS